MNSHPMLGLSAGGGVLLRRFVLVSVAAALGLFTSGSCLQAQVVTSYPNMAGMSDAGQMYMEGYFLPPVTSSPVYPTWTPDGQSITFSYQGRIWTVPAEGGIASQVTTGPGYHSQPEWSPDGSALAYTADVDDNLDIFVLNPDTGEPRRITTHSQMDVRPRWSADGTKLLFTSARGGYFRLWLYDLEADSLSALSYSSAYNSSEYHDMAGDWIPGREEAVLVSGRAGKRLGSGSLWRMKIDTSAAEMIRSEETNYQAAPVVSPTGAVLAYISHQTGNNELYLLPSDGGETAQLTHTDRDEFFPAWSPDGQRLAYVRNGGTDSGGKGFQLFTISRNGGKPAPVTIETYEWSEPTGSVSVRVSNPEGDLLPSRIYVSASDGRSYFPEGSLASVVAMTEDYYFHTAGEFSITVPAGEVSIEAWRGFEYTPVEETVNVQPGSSETVSITLERWTDMADRGWYSGDNHIHVNYGGHYHISPKDLLLKARAEDLNVANGMVSNKYSRIMDLEHFLGHPHEGTGPRRSVYYNEEYRPRWFGHLSLLNLTELVYPIYLAYEGTPYSAHYPHNAITLRRVHDQGGVGGYVHPFGLIHSVWASHDPAWGDYGRTRELPVDVALGLADFYDLGCVWTDEEASAAVWYRLLNTGGRIAATAGSDAMTDIWRRPAIGGSRVYVYTGEDEINYDSWIEAMTAGRAFVTTGPMISLDVAGRGMGEELTLNQPDTVLVRATVRSVFTIHRLEIVKNGEVVRTVGANGNPHEIEVEVPVGMDSSGWIAARAIGPLEHGMMDSYAYAHTNPVYVIVDGEPIESSEDARHFVRWIDRNIEQLEELDTWLRSSEKEEVLSTFREARDVYRAQVEGSR